MQITVWPEGWPVPNYVNPEIRGSPSLFIITLVITTFVVFLRLYSRYIVTRSPGIDDIFLVAGFIFSIGQTVTEYKALTTWGWNMHLWDVPFQRLEYVRLAAWLNEFFFVLGTGCTKISVLLVYRRISNGSNNRWFIRLTLGAIAVTAIYSLVFTLEIMLVCRPLNSYWKSYSVTYDKDFTCGNERVPIILSAAVSVISDIYASVLPMLLVRKLRLSSRQRISLFLLFSVGLLTAGTGVARFYYLWRLTINYKPGPHTRDSTWLGWPTYAWTDIEAHLAIICASTPALKVFFVRILQEPLTKAYTYSTSRTTLSRSRSSSSKGMILPSRTNTSLTGNSSLHRPNYTNTHHHQKATITTISEIRSASQPISSMGPRNPDQDLESFSLEKRVDKPLPAWPVWQGPVGYESRTFCEASHDSRSESEDRKEFLSLYLPVSRFSRRY